MNKPSIKIEGLGTNLENMLLVLLFEAPKPGVQEVYEATYRTCLNKLRSTYFFLVLQNAALDQVRPLLEGGAYFPNKRSKIIFINTIYPFNDPLQNK